MRLVLAALLLLLASSPAKADPILLGASTYTQNFNTLASSGASATLPDGWRLLETGSNANTTYTAGTGSANQGDTYSFGAAGSSERALGGLFSGTLNPTFGAFFENAGGSEITSVSIAFTGEQWRFGASNGRTGPDRLDFQYSLDATALNNGTWLDFNALDFSSPNTTTLGALDGNAALNRTALSATISGLNIPVGGTFSIRFRDSDITPGSDDGLAVDDFSLTAAFNAPAVVTPLPASALLWLAGGACLAASRWRRKAAGRS